MHVRTTVKFKKTTGSPINMKAKLHGCLKCGKPGKVREWNMSQENLEKSGNVIEGAKKNCISLLLEKLIFRLKLPLCTSKL